MIARARRKSCQAAALAAEKGGVKTQRTSKLMNMSEQQ